MTLTNKIDTIIASKPNATGNIRKAIETIESISEAPISQIQKDPDLVGLIDRLYANVSTTAKNPTKKKRSVAAIRMKSATKTRVSMARKTTATAKNKKVVAASVEPTPTKKKRVAAPKKKTVVAKAAKATAKKTIARKKAVSGKKTVARKKVGDLNTKQEAALRNENARLKKLQAIAKAEANVLTVLTRQNAAKLKKINEISDIKSSMVSGRTYKQKPVAKGKKITATQKAKSKIQTARNVASRKPAAKQTTSLLNKIFGSTK